MDRRAGLLLATAALALAVGGASCSSCSKTSGSATAREDIALVPKDTGVVGMINVGRVRDTSFWRKLLDLREDAARDRKKALEEEKKNNPDTVKEDDGTPKDFEDFVARCGFDPFKQLDSIFIAFPSTPTEGEFGLIAHGDFDEAKLVGCAKAMVKKEGSELAETDYNGKKLYNDASSGSLTFTFLDKRTAVFAGREWVKQIVDLAAGKAGESAKANQPLMDLMKQARTSDALWGIGLIADSTREKLRDNETLKSAGSLKDVYGSIDFPSGMTLSLNADLGADADAADLAKKIGEQLVEAKKNGQVMMLGFASYIDAIKVEPKGASLKFSVKLNQQQVDELVTRVAGLFAGGGGLSVGGPKLNPGIFR